MNGFQIAMMAGAAIAVIVSWKLPHALLWVFLGTVNAVACDLFYAYNLPYPAAFTLACDALMCLTIHWFARERWELGLFIIFQFSVLISVLRLWSVIDGEDTYRLALELCNWAALLMIAGTAILGGAGGHVLRNAWSGYVRGAYRYLRSPPKTDHWRKVRQ
jgi:hypothetical protein